MRILIIEDDDGAALALRHFLEPLASCITIVTNMTEALAALRGVDQLDLITVDLGLPDSDVQETIAQIIEIRRMRPDSFIVVVTGQELPDLATVVAAAGADGLVTKQSDAFSSKGFLQLLAAIVKRYTMEPRLHQQSIALLQRVATKLANLQTHENPSHQPC